LSDFLRDSAVVFKTDAFVNEVAVPFKPEDTRLGQYTFLPYVRTGLATQIDGTAGTRATVTISVQVRDNDGNFDAPVKKTLTLRGPGDVIGIDPAQVIRRVPADATASAEETFLAHIEFDRPEMPWLFTPEKPAADRLNPWIALVVCDAAVTRLAPGVNGLPQQLHTRRGELPPLEDAWAWAHAQILGAATGSPGIADRLSEAYGATNLSRLLCPRRLAPNTSYIAAVVPTYDCGVQAGLGREGGTLAHAWLKTDDPATEIDLPAYVVWRFSVGAAGDFRSLAERIVPVKADWRIGRRIVDASQPGSNLNLAPTDPGRVQTLACALVSPADPPKPGESWNPAKRDALRQAVDAGSNASDPLPRVAPRMYARYQRGTNAIGDVFGTPPTSAVNADQDWFSQLNTNPMHRIVAGIGTRVAQKDQELLMQSAWAQAGELRKVNESLVRLQFGRYVSQSLHDVHLARLALGELTQVLRGVHDKVKPPATPATIYGVIDTSVVPSNALGSAFRRATRVRGPLARFTDAAGKAALRNLVANAAGFRDMRRPVAKLDGINTLSPDAIKTLPLQLIADKLGVPAANAAQALANKLATRSRPETVADIFAAPPSTWKVPAVNVNLANRAAAMVNDRIQSAVPANTAREPGRAEALAGLVVGMTNSGFGTSQSGALLRRLHRAQPFTAPVRIVEAPSGFDAKVVGRVARFGTPVASESIAIPPQVMQAPPPALVRFETAASRTLQQIMSTAPATTSMQHVASMFAEVAKGMDLAAMPRYPERAPLALTRAMLLETVAPGRTVTAYAKARLGRLPDWLPADWFANLRVDPVMKAPRFDRPMYEAVDAYGRDWLVPGLGTIDEPDFVTLLVTNPIYTEALLVGLSDEVGRELLWRGYDTDQRGTYFFRFWDAFNDELAAPIHKFGSMTALGAHLKGASAGSRVVLVIRGELLRRYPDAIIAAARAKSAHGKPEFQDPGVPGARARVLFYAPLPPDYMFVGFDLTETQVENEPWWFLIAEHPTAPRFGMAVADALDPGSGEDRDKLDWDDLGGLFRQRFLTPSIPGFQLVVKETPVPLSGPPTVTWPGNAAVTAHVLLRDPVRAAFEARSMLQGAK
jgi:hypothetical protein